MGGGGGVFQGHAQKPLAGLIYLFSSQDCIDICQRVLAVLASSSPYMLRSVNPVSHIATYKYIKCLHPLYIFSPLSILVIHPFLSLISSSCPTSVCLFSITSYCFSSSTLSHIPPLQTQSYLSYPPSLTPISFPSPSLCHAHCFSVVFISFTSSLCYSIPFL